MTAMSRRLAIACACAALLCLPPGEPPGALEPAAPVDRAELAVRVRVLDPCLLPELERRGARPVCPPAPVAAAAAGPEPATGIDPSQADGSR